MLTETLIRIDFDEYLISRIEKILGIFVAEFHRITVR